MPWARRGGAVATERIPPAQEPITIALIEDNRLVREGITALLGELDDIVVVASSARADLTRLQQARPAVVLLDLGLHREDSLKAAEKIKSLLPMSRVVVMDLLPAYDDVIEFVNAGVAGFIMKDASLDDLVDTIRAVAGGANVLPPELTSGLFSQIARDAVAVGRSRRLGVVRMTPREREVIMHIADGRSNKEIAAELHIATHTVKSHVRNIMEKLTLHTRLQIAAYAHRAAQAPQDTTNKQT